MFLRKFSKLKLNLLATCASICLFCCSFATFSIAEDSDIDNVFSQKIKKERSVRDKDFLYVDIGFSIAGMGFKMSDGSVISNGFIAPDPLLGLTVKIGYERIQKWLYFGAEIFASAWFSTAGGYIGSNSAGDSISLDGIGNSTTMIGINFKPGIPFYNKKIAVYGILGVAYNFLNANYSSGASQDVVAFSMDGFGLNYGVGLKFAITEYLIAFTEFSSLAPIKGGGNSPWDRTAVSNGATFSAIKTSEIYSLSIGLGLRL